MISDPELDQWQTLWRREQASDASIAERSRKAVRQFRRWIYLEVLITVVMGGGAAVWAVTARQSPVTFLAIWIWLSLLIAWLFRFFNDWNNWTGAAVDTSAYLTVLLRRLNANLRGAEFGAVLFFVQLLVVSAWIFRRSNLSMAQYLLLPVNAVFALGTVVFVVWLVRYRGRLRREVDELRKLQIELGEDSAGSFSPPKFSWRLERIVAPIIESVRKLDKLRKKKSWTS